MSGKGGTSSFPGMLARATLVGLLWFGLDLKSVRAQQPSNQELAVFQEQANQSMGLTASEVFTAHSRMIGDVVEVDIFLDGQPATLSLTPRSVRGPNFEVKAQLADGSYITVDPGPVRTYWGRVKDLPGSVVAASLLDEGLFARVALEGMEHFWIEPLKKYVPGAPANAHVTYRASNNTNPMGTCGVDNLPPPPPAPPEPPIENPPNGEPDPGAGGVAGGIAGGGLPVVGDNLCIAQIGIDADYEYYVDYGSSVNAVTNRVESVINSMNVQYFNEVGITHLIAAIFVRTAEPDPFTSTNPYVLIDQLATQWLNNHGNIQRDVVHLFTGKDLSSGIIGLASLSAICSYNNGYGLVQSDYDPLYSCVTDLSSHELGHNWAAQHCNCTSYTMNPWSTCTNQFHPTETIPQITNFRNSVGCLQCGSILNQAFEMNGETQSDQFGRSVTLVEDVNGDNQPDLFIGAPYNDENGTDAGKVYMRSGANGSLIWSAVGEAAGDRFGWSVAAMGNKVIVGAPLNDAGGTNAGRIYVVDAASGATLKKKKGQAAKDQFGYSVAGGKDINKDGHPDFIVGAPLNDQNGSNAGAAYVYSGTGSFPNLKKLYGPKKGDRFGWSVAVLGRVNTDNYDDFIIGAPQADAPLINAGKAFVYSGKNYSKLFTRKGIQANEQLGYVVADAGHANGDTRADFAIASPFYNGSTAGEDSGFVQVLSGSNASIIWSKVGEAANDQFGLALALAGDPNGDGRHDLAVGAPLNDAGGDLAGRVYVISGATGQALSTITGGSQGDQLGLALAGRGELNSPDRARVIIGGATVDSVATDAGRAYQFWSIQSGLAATIGNGPPIGPNGCAEDIATNNAVDVDDLLAVIAAWGECPGLCPPTCEADLAPNCVVDVDDLLAVLSAWGGCE